MARTCGIRIGPRRYELVVLDGSAKKHRIVAFQTGEFPQGGEDPLADAAATLKAALKSTSAPLDTTAIAIDTGLAAFRTIKLPDLEEGKIEQVIKFEVEGALPQWNIDDVVVDFLKLDAVSGETNLLVTAVPKADLGREIDVCVRAGCEPLEVELEATAMVNAALCADLCHVDEAQVLVHVGETSTAVVVMDGGKLRSIRAIHIGALSHEPGRPSPPEPAEEGAEPAPAAPVPEEVDPEERQRLLELAVSRIRRELGRTVSGARTANPIAAIYVCGWELPELIGSQLLDVPVYELDVFEEDSGQPVEGAAPLVAAYGVALRLFGDAPLAASLRREELRFSGAFERIELPVTLAAIALLFLTALFNLFEFKQIQNRNIEIDAWRRSANNFMLGDARNGVRGYLNPVPEDIQKYLDRVRKENDKPGQTNNPEKDPERSRLQQMQYVNTILVREIAKLDDQLGNTGEITHPQSALEGMTMVLGTLSELGESVGRVAVRMVEAEYQAGRSGGKDSVEVTLDLTFFADDALAATAHMELYTSTLREKPWVVSVTSPGSKELAEGTEAGVYVDHYVVTCDLSSLRQVAGGQS
jgi:Tfp pilus assembly PilM family ATPase